MFLDEGHQTVSTGQFGIIALLVVLAAVGVFVYLKWPVLRERWRTWRQRDGKA